MCIIADKPAGVEMLSDEDIKHMFTHNPDGAGFAIQGWFEHIVYNKKTGQEEVRRRFEVHYQKGFMNVDDLIEALGPKEKLKDYRVVIHCRIKTSGNSDAPTTHPFPLSSCYGDLKKTEGDGAVLFHNGVFQGLGGIIDKRSSDTQDFVVGIANRLLSVPNHISKISQVIAKKVAGECRVLILYPNPKYPDFRLGTWHDNKGVHYSNTGYRHDWPSSSTPAASRLHGSPQNRWDDDEWEDYYRGYYGYGPDDDEDRMKKDYGHDYDEWGCNHADGAWPSTGTDWIKFKTEVRFQTVRNAAKKVVTNEKGNKLYYFAYNEKEPWIFDEENLQAFTNKGYEMVLDKQDAEEEELNELFADNVVWFASTMEFEDFEEEHRKIGDNTYERDGKTWYVDWQEMVAYTDQGLKLMFKPGEVGHVRRALEKDGYNSYQEQVDSLKQAAESVSKEDMKKAFKALQEEEKKCVLH